MTQLESLATCSADVLHFDPELESTRIADTIRHQVLRQLRRKGVVLGLSGGVDSSVAAALCVRALGQDAVLGLFMPERESSADSLHLGRLLANCLGIKTVLEDISPTLEAVGTISFVCKNMRTMASHN